MAARKREKSIYGIGHMTKWPSRPYMIKKLCLEIWDVASEELVL